MKCLWKKELYGTCSKPFLFCHLLGAYYISEVKFWQSECCTTIANIQRFPKFHYDKTVILVTNKLRRKLFKIKLSTNTCHGSLLLCKCCDYSHNFSWLQGYCQFYLSVSQGSMLVLPLLLSPIKKIKRATLIYCHLLCTRHDARHLYCHLTHNKPPRSLFILARIRFNCNRNLK